MNKKGIGAGEMLWGILKSAFFIWLILIFTSGGFSLGLSLNDVSPIGWGVIIILGVILFWKKK